MKSNKTEVKKEEKSCQRERERERENNEEKWKRKSSPVLKRRLDEDEDDG